MTANAESSGDTLGVGGFMPQASANGHGLLSPAMSTTSSSITSFVLPKPRSQPLRSGSAKETMFINYMDREIMSVTRRFAKKFSDRGPEANEDGVAQTDDESRVKTTEDGYSSFREVAKDVVRLISVLWISGTPSLQVQYLLTLALLVMTYIPSFPPAPRAMFKVLGKLDHAFASLVTGRDIETGETLPGFGFGGLRGLSATEKVRIKSLTERTRIVVVEVMGSGEDIEEEDPKDDEDEDDEDEQHDQIDVDDFGDDWGMEVARVYDRTVVELGETLGDGDFAT